MKDFIDGIGAGFLIIAVGSLFIALLIVVGQ